MSRLFGVLLMAYGSPNSLDEVEPYFTHIRGGRRPPPEAVEGLKARYRRIGGRSGLLEVTLAQAKGLEEALNPLTIGERWRVWVGMKHWKPSIAEAADSMAKAGVGRVVGVALAPHYSRMSVGSYIEAAKYSLECMGLSGVTTFVERWGNHPLFLRAVAWQIRKAMEGWSAEGTLVLFTAHSLPERIRSWGDPYERELLRSAAGVAHLSGLEHWRFAFQSASHTGEPWLGPDLHQVLEEAAREGRFSRVLVCPIGFVTDNLETLYDLDIEAQEHAQRLGLAFRRVPCLNASPLLVDTLVALVIDALSAST
ncbi:MAG: ferrochelatase [Dehalococcoidia bacterium]